MVQVIGFGFDTGSDFPTQRLVEPHSPADCRKPNGNPMPPGCLFGFLPSPMSNVQSLQRQTDHSHCGSTNTEPGVGSNRVHHSALWVDQYGTGSGSDRVYHSPLW